MVKPRMNFLTYLISTIALMAASGNSPMFGEDGSIEDMAGTIAESLGDLASDEGFFMDYLEKMIR